MKSFMRLLFVSFLLMGSQDKANAFTDHSFKSAMLYMVGTDLKLDITTEFFAAENFYELKLAGTENTIAGNVLNIKIYYLMSGLHGRIPVFHLRKDTVNLGTLTNVKEIKVEVYLSDYTDTIFIPESISLFLPLHTENIRAIENDMKIFPNPSNGCFTVSSSHDFKGDMFVLNMLGQVVYNEQIHTTLPLRKEIKLEGLSEGIYLLKVENRDRASVHRFNIINNN
jgi:hypothetical protein